MKSSGLLMSQKPGRYNGFTSDYSPEPESKDEFLNSAYDFVDVDKPFSLGNTGTKSNFQHNLLLPTKNANEFKKLLTGSKQKFAEMFKNRHKLDNINFRPVRNTLGVAPMATIASKGARYRSLDTKTNDERTPFTNLKQNKSRENNIQRPRKFERTYVSQSLNNNISSIEPLPNMSETKTINNLPNKIKLKSAMKSTLKSINYRSPDATLNDRVNFDQASGSPKIKDAYKTSTLPRVKYNFKNSKEAENNIRNSHANSFNKSSFVHNGAKASNNTSYVETNIPTQTSAFHPTRPSQSNQAKPSQNKSLVSLKARSDQDLIK